MSKASLVFSLALLVLAGVMALFSEAKVVFERNFGVEAEAKPNGSSARALPLVGTLTLEGQNNLQLEAAADSYPRGLFLEGMLVHELSQHAVPFGISLDPSDLSPTQSRTVHVGGLGSGPYAVTLKPEWGEGGTPPSRIQLTVREDVFLASQLPLFFLLLWLLPVVELVRGFAFERARWAESDFG